MNYRITIQYDGSRYNGWQKQGNTSNTIQGRLEEVLERMAGQAVEVHGAGRTDAGVHALGQTANFHLQGEWDPGEIRRYLNRYLPDDIEGNRYRSCSAAVSQPFKRTGKSISLSYRNRRAKSRL